MNITIEQMLTLAEEYGIEIETGTSDSGIFCEEQDGSIHKMETTDLMFDTYTKEG